MENKNKLSFFSKFNTSITPIRKWFSLQTPTSSSSTNPKRFASFIFSSVSTLLLVTSRTECDPGCGGLMSSHRCAALQGKCPAPVLSPIPNVSIVSIVKLLGLWGFGWFFSKEWIMRARTCFWTPSVNHAQVTRSWLFLFSWPSSWQTFKSFILLFCVYPANVSEWLEMN